MSPSEALTADGYDMTWGTNVLGQSIRDVPLTGRRHPNTRIRRTVLLHGIAYPCIIQSLHIREQVPCCQPLLANGNNGFLGLWLWPRFFNLQGFTKEEEDVRHYVV